MVYGIVTLIEGDAGELIRQTWRRIEAALGAEAVREMNTPHASFHVANGYEVERTDALLQSVAWRSSPFEVATAGLGLSARDDDDRVTWISLVRSPALDRLHAALWDEASALATGVYQQYAPPIWFPHVTLSYSARVQEAPAALLELLRDGRIPDAVRIDNVALIEDTGDGHRIVSRVGFGIV